MIHQTQKKSKPCVASLTVVLETPFTACPSNQKRVRAVKYLIFVVTRMIQCRKREEFHSAVKHLWGGGVRRSWCSMHPVRNLQAPFPTAFYIDLNQGWYWRHQCKRQIPSCYFHLDQVGSKERKIFFLLYLNFTYRHQPSYSKLSFTMGGARTHSRILLELS